MGRQVVKHLNSNKQGNEFITAMAEQAKLNEIVIQHSDSGETALWTLEGEKPVKFINEDVIDSKIESSESVERERAMAAEQALHEEIVAETERATSAETELQEAIDAETERAMAAEQALDEKIDSLNESTEIVKITDGLDANVREAYELKINNETKGERILVYKDSALKQVYLGHVDDTLESDSAPEVVAGTGDTALCFIYYTVDGKYQLVTVNVEVFLSESEFLDGLRVDNNKVYVKIDETSEKKDDLPYLTVSSNGIKLQGLNAAINNAVNTEKERAMAAEEALDDKIEAEVIRATEAESSISGNVDTLSGSVEELSASTVSEIERLDTYDAVLLGKIEAETTRATEAENTISGNVDTLSAATVAIEEKVTDINVKVGDDSTDYLTVEQTPNVKEYTIDTKVVNLADATSSNTGLLDASDVKSYLEELIIDCGEF